MTCRVPEEVIRSMAHKLEPPDPMSNPWEAFSFIVNAQLFRNSSKEILQTCRCVVKAAGNFDATQIRLTRKNGPLFFWSLLSPASNPPVIPNVPEHRSESARQESRLVCDKSLIHKLDKRLRKIVGARIAVALEVKLVLLHFVFYASSFFGGKWLYAVGTNTLLAF